MLKTLAGKHKSSVPKMAARFKANIETPHGTRTCFEAVRHRGNNKPHVARFGGIPLTRLQRVFLRTLRTPRRSARAPRRETRRTRTTRPAPNRMGQDHGNPATQDPRRLPALPRPDPQRPGPGHTPHNIGHWRAGCRESWHVRFGGRPCGKGPANNGHLAARPTQPSTAHGAKALSVTTGPAERVSASTTKLPVRIRRSAPFPSFGTPAQSPARAAART
jgi:hypothetical protein